MCCCNCYLLQKKITYYMATVMVMALFMPYVFSQTKQRKKVVNSVKDLYYTDSCLDPPYTIPHPRVAFYLYTRNTQNSPEKLNITNLESLYQSHFNRIYPTKIVIHGFGGGRNMSPSPDIRKAYFYTGNYNIIIMDYGSLVREPCLSQMDWGPRYLAKTIAKLIDYLSRHPRGIKANQIHIIGYSVGAHIGGLVANYLNLNQHGKLARITGLDPTIVFYMGNNKSMDLDKTDAKFVDILHTSAGILGQWGPNGHADFYINGGTRQPGCSNESLFQTLACDHTKVTPYFIESIYSRKGFWAAKCNLFQYTFDLCNPDDKDYVLMGEHVSHKVRGVYYATTNAVAPYAQGHPKKKGYLLNFKFESTDQ